MRKGEGLIESTRKGWKRKRARWMREEGGRVGWGKGKGLDEERERVGRGRRKRF